MKKENNFRESGTIIFILFINNDKIYFYLNSNLIVSNIF